MITIGIDPGLSGAIGLLKNGKYAGVWDMPTVVKGSGSVKSEVDPAGLIKLLLEACSEENSAIVALERVNSMPGQGVSSVFSLGDSFGCARSSVAAARLEVVYVTPARWKNHFKLTSSKDMCRAAAVRMFPEAPLNLKKHSDRAEALLMARWLYETRKA